MLKLRSRLFSKLFTRLSPQATLIAALREQAQPKVTLGYAGKSCSHAAPYHLKIIKNNQLAQFSIAPLESRIETELPAAAGKQWSFQAGQLSLSKYLLLSRKALLATRGADSFPIISPLKWLKERA